MDHGEGPLLILAGAGSGKTRVLTARIARLILDRGVSPSEILAVTFTNKAAGVMRERIGLLLGCEPAGLWIGTFHAIAARLLRREGHATNRGSGFTIYDEEDSLRAIRQAMDDAGYDPQGWSPATIRSRISDAKNALLSPEEYSVSAFDLLSRAVSDVYPAYERILTRCNAFDFDDLLLHATRLLERHEDVAERYARRFRHVLVDEYQDTNRAQYRMIRSLGRVHGNVCVVGDDDQSIYGWRGADLRNILDFERDFPGAAVVRLEENYRSTPPILEVANRVIAQNRRRKEKRLHTVRREGDPVLLVRTADERAEAKWTVNEIRPLADRGALADCAILYRTNAQSRPYEDALRGAGLPYSIVGSVRFYERREIKDVLAYLQLAVNPSDEVAFRRAVSWPRRGVGSVTTERLQAAAREGGLTLLEAAARAPELPGVPPAGARALREFATELLALGEMLPEATAEEAIRECVRRFGLATALEAEEEGAERVANLTELLAAASAFDPAEVEDPGAGATELELYLQCAALRSEMDEYEEGTGSVTLMTLHNAKGLEFPVVFIGGLEEGLFPLARAIDSPDGLEEERRLFYVGITRAMDRLVLTFADRRWRAGSQGWSEPSSFLEELPEGPVERRVIGDPFDGRRARRLARPWRAWEDAGSAPDFEWVRSAHRGTGSGLRYDYGDTQLPLQVEPGARVVHPRFGEGTILAVSGSGRGAKVEIEFDGGGRKKVVVAHAGLRPA